MLNNLRAAMAAKKISVVAMAKLIGTTEKTVNNKINSVSEFTISEALLIKENLFAEYELSYLFASTE